MEFVTVVGHGVCLFYVLNCPLYCLGLVLKPYVLEYTSRLTKAKPQEVSMI